jgi:hypothetical protein
VDLSWAFEIARELGKSVTEVQAMPLWEFQGWQAKISAERKARTGG